jgi:hypothetical protein
MKLLNMHSSPVSCHILPLRCKYPPVLLQLQYTVCSSLSVSDQIAHPYKITGRILVLYILIFTVLRRKTLTRMVGHIPILNLLLIFS